MTHARGQPARPHHARLLNHNHNHNHSGTTTTTTTTAAGDDLDDDTVHAGLSADLVSALDLDHIDEHFFGARVHKPAVQSLPMSVPVPVPVPVPLSSQPPPGIGIGNNSNYSSSNYSNSLSASAASPASAYLNHHHHNHSRPFAALSSHAPPPVSGLAAGLGASAGGASLAPASPAPSPVKGIKGFAPAPGAPGIPIPPSVHGAPASPSASAAATASSSSSPVSSSPAAAAPAPAPANSMLVMMMRQNARQQAAFSAQAAQAAHDSSLLLPPPPSSSSAAAAPLPMPISVPSPSRYASGQVSSADAFSSSFVPSSITSMSSVASSFTSGAPAGAHMTAMTGQGSASGSLLANDAAQDFYKQQQHQHSRKRSEPHFPLSHSDKVLLQQQFQFQQQQQQQQQQQMQMYVGSEGADLDAFNHFSSSAPTAPGPMNAGSQRQLFPATPARPSPRRRSTTMESFKSQLQPIVTDASMASSRADTMSQSPRSSNMPASPRAGPRSASVRDDSSFPGDSASVLAAQTALNNAAPNLKDPKKSALYKTELCRSWEETGTCRYGTRCQFAHSASELRIVERHPKYKTEMCRTFWERGTCPYGKRCCFIHMERGSAEALKRSSRTASADDSSPIPISGGGGGGAGNASAGLSTSVASGLASSYGPGSLPMPPSSMGQSPSHAPISALSSSYHQSLGRKLSRTRSVSDGFDASFERSSMPNPSAFDHASKAMHATPVTVANPSVSSSSSMSFDPALYDRQPLRPRRTSSVEKSLLSRILPESSMAMAMPASAPLQHNHAGSVPSMVTNLSAAMGSSLPGSGSLSMSFTDDLADRLDNMRIGATAASASSPHGFHGMPISSSAAGLPSPNMGNQTRQGSMARSSRRGFTLPSSVSGSAAEPISVIGSLESYAFRDANGSGASLNMPQSPIGPAPGLHMMAMQSNASADFVSPPSSPHRPYSFASSSAAPTSWGSFSQQ